MSPLGVPTGEVWLPDIGPPGDWVARAACRGHEQPDLWFPGPGDNTSFAAAAAICGTCPVAAECLEYAIVQRIDYGVWGGLGEKGRRQFTRSTPRPRRPAPGHGNPGRYRYGCRCDECREAHRAEVAGYREAARERVS